MSYAYQHDETPLEGTRRIVRERIDKALDELENNQDRDEAIHEARKNMKKIRAVLRLVRDSLGEDAYDEENAWYRDIARLFSDVRDSAVLIETLDTLGPELEGQFDDRLFWEARDKLAQQHHAAQQATFDDGVAMSTAIGRLRMGHERTNTWVIEEDDFDAFADGLKRVYERGRKRMEPAYEEQSVEAFHDWRKRVKYLWYQTRLLEPAWPDLIDEYGDALHDLANLLGEDHDLMVLKEHLEVFEDEDARQAVIDLIDQRSAEYRKEAQALGERIYAEKPKKFVKRLKSYWDSWREGEAVITE
jgi:CHAD domain-containing protein